MNKIYDMIIIGGGTAGMTAAIYGYRSGKDVLIIEKSVYGGQIISTSELENYPGFPAASGYDFASELYGQIKDMDIERITDEVQDLAKERTAKAGASLAATKAAWRVSCLKGSYLGKAVIIATGTKNRELGIPKENDYLGRGLSYCATCDGAFHKNKTVAVVGGGNTALEEALYLSLLCKKVYLIHRSDKFTGDESLQKRVEDAVNISPLMNTSVTALYGDDSHGGNDDNLAQIEVTIVGTSDGESNEVKQLDVSGLFVAIGRVPQNQPFSNLVALDDRGYIVAGENCHTSSPGIFAAGDCRTKDLRQLVTAAADGATAATEAGKYRQ